MAGGTESDTLAFSQTMVGQAQVVFDVVALPPETPLIRLAQKLDKQIISGAEVIALQAVEQFVLYTGVRPDAALVNEAAAFARGVSLSAREGALSPVSYSGSIRFAFR
jgi:shikimate dehydrogenase